jgi:SAM-dependent methyltransferase
MMAESMSWADASIFSGYANHAQRYGFAFRYCSGKRVIDVGCGIGYGSHLLASNGAVSVLGVDLSAEAIAEASARYQRENLRFVQGDAERLADISHEWTSQPQVVVSFENLEHLHDPSAFLSSASKILAGTGGVLVLSTPNAARESDGSQNPYHMNEFTREELQGLLVSVGGRLTWYGQWETWDFRLRAAKERAAFRQMVGVYFNPMVRLGRLIRRVLGRCPTAPPVLRIGAYAGDYRIEKLEAGPFPWPPAVLLAICSFGHAGDSFSEAASG